MELVSKLASALKIDLIELVKLAAILKIDNSKELPSEDREAIISFYRVKHKIPSKNSPNKDKVAGNGNVDHIDRNPLNNTLANLRFVSRSQNASNSSPQKNSTGYKGVNFARGKYRAICNKDGKRYYNGEYDTAEEAAKARDELAIRLFGEHAALNFPK